MDVQVTKVMRCFCPHVLKRLHATFLAWRIDYGNGRLGGRTVGTVPYLTSRGVLVERPGSCSLNGWDGWMDRPYFLVMNILCR